MSTSWAAFQRDSDFVNWLVRRYLIDEGSAERLRSMLRRAVSNGLTIEMAPEYVLKDPATPRAIAARLRQMAKEAAQVADSSDPEKWYPPNGAPFWVWSVANDEDSNPFVRARQDRD
ncbi:hypothetical protein ASD04_17800 [Devosia sp. Root436]|uniref:hypothetical protein n=1 Tax=Devosia sp. Root436 TaxID=1736537 RepID=UPI0006F4615B|nr:hypothetical protein [Devosia sp. Root436]KQX34095.1 hypothetical protein ASD04_17800 [Devosia sp. Root436]